MGTPNCTFYDEAIPYDAVIPYDGICTTPAFTNRPIYWVGKRSSWEKDKEEKKRRRQRIVIAVSSEVFSVNDRLFDRNGNEIRVSEEYDPSEVHVAVGKLMNAVQEPVIDIRSRVIDSDILPSVTSELSDNNSGGLPEVEGIDDPTLDTDEDEISVESRMMDDNGNVQIMCEVVTNENPDLIIKVEAEEDDNRDTNK